MFRRSVRITCLVIALLATAGLGYRVFQDETTLTNERNAAAELDRAVGRTAEALLDLRASLHAYVAPGQGLPFWGKRAQEGIQGLRGQLASLNDRIAPSGGSMKQSLDAVAQLEAAERRARTYVSRDEMQLAGDVIFTEVRDVLAAMTGEVESLEAGLQRDHDRRTAGIRREQLMLAGGALAIWMLVAVLLLPTDARPGVEDPAAWRSDLKDTLSRPVAAAPEAPRAPASSLKPQASEPAPEGVPLVALRQVSEICADLAALTDPGALQGALERVNGVLNATGLIVWVASNDGSTLTPVATHGFDPKIVSRIGKVARDGANLTAAAFRDNASKISVPSATAPGALAVPMCGPTGPTGVLSVELKTGQSVEEVYVALAAIVAAQLATLTMPVAEQAGDVSAVAPDAKIEATESTAQSA